MLGNISGKTCFCLYDNALWMYAMVPVHWVVEQSCCWECLEDRTQRYPPIFFLFWVQNSYLFPIFWPLSFLFSYFLSVICHLTPCTC